MYLPQEDLRRYGADPGLRRATPEWSEVMRFEIARCRRLYVSADIGIGLLPHRSARCVRAARLLYSRILDVIEAQDYDVFTHRARVPTWQKAAMVGRLLSAGRCDPAWPEPDGRAGRSSRLRGRRGGDDRHAAARARPPPAGLDRGGRRTRGHGHGRGDPPLGRRRAPCRCGNDCHSSHFDRAAGYDDRAAVRALPLLGALRPTAAGVPALVPAAWFAMALPAREVGPRGARRRRSSPGRRVLLGAAALTAWDLFLDPQMVAEGYWRWHRPGRYRGIPLTNYPRMVRRPAWA